MTLLAWFRSNASLVALVSLVGAVYGISTLRRLPSGIYPELEFPRIVIVARVGDLPPEVVQTSTTRPLEEAVSTVPNMRRVRARTIRGATELSVQFEDGTDMWRTLQLVEAHIADVRRDLPSDAEIRVQRITPASLPILTFDVSGEVDPRVLRETADRLIRPALTRVLGVGAIEVQGGDIRELEVILRPAALAAAHLTPSAIADRISRDDRVAAVGRAYADHQVLTVLAASEPTTPGALAALPVAEGPNGPVLLGTLADVIEGAADRTSSISGPHGDSVAITVSRAIAANAAEVVAGARAAVADLEHARVLPAGVHVAVVYNQAELIDDALAGVRDAILIGIALGVVVLAVFLRDVRAGVTAALAIPITLSWTFGAMGLTHQSLNLMSLGGLAVAIGLVIDDAIVIVEAIVRRLEDGMPIRDAVGAGTRDLSAAVLGTTATTVTVFVPLLWLDGEVGSFFTALGITLSAAVVLSLVAAIAVVPLIARTLLREREPRTSRVAAAYGRVVRRAVSRPLLSVLAIGALVIGGAVAACRVSTGFLPAMDEGTVVIDFFLPPGTSLEESNQIMARVDRALATMPDVAGFTRRTGAEMGPAAATQQNRGDILVRLSPRSERPSVYRVMDELRARLSVVAPEARLELAQVLQDVLSDLSGNPRPIEIEVFGPDPKVRARLAGQIGERVRRVAGLDDVVDGAEGDLPVLRIDVDPIAVRRLGIDAAQVVDDLGVSVGGRVVAQARVGDRNLDVRVRMPDDVRFDPERIAAISLPYGSATIPLSAVSGITRPVSPGVLARENLAPVTIASATVDAGRDLAAATAAVREVLADLPAPDGYRVQVGGQLADARKAQHDLGKVFGLGAALVLVILLVQLRSIRLSFVVLLSAPLAVVGALFTLVAFSIPLNVSSLMGCVLLTGLVVKNGILLLEHARSLEREGTQFSDALAIAGERRLRPILMTTATAIAGLVPLAFALGAGSELQRPLAVATIGGLVLSTAVTLFALPALAALVMRSSSSPR